jgi:hypothetical protein
MRSGVVAAVLLCVAVATVRSGMAMPQDDRTAGGVPAAAAVRPAAVDAARILFVHQSVGENVVEGLQALQPRPGSARRLRIVDLKELGEAAAGSGGFFAHARLGRNGRPAEKTDAFVSTLEAGWGERLDVAFHKYCFADIDARTDVRRLFDDYRAAMDRVRREFPHLRLLHVTAPLVRVQAGPRAVVKRLIGRMPDHYADNIARERFNALMRRAYDGREPVFDLAALEASRPGKAPEAFRFKDATVYELLSEYTDDGAHLNEAASARMAVHLMSVLEHALSGAGR